MFLVRFFLITKMLTLREKTLFKMYCLFPAGILIHIGQLINVQHNACHNYQVARWGKKIINSESRKT